MDTRLGQSTENFTITIPAGESIVKDVTGTNIYITSSSTEEFQLRLDDGAAFDVFKKFGYKTREIPVEVNGTVVKARDSFSKVELTNPTAGSIQVSLYIGVGEIIDNRLSADGSIKSNVCNDIDTVTKISCANGAQTKIHDGETDATKIWVWCDAPTGTSPISILWGDNNITSTRGFPSPPQQAWQVETTAKLYVYNSSGAAVDFYVMVEKIQ